MYKKGSIFTYSDANRKRKSSLVLKLVAF